MEPSRVRSRGTAHLAIPAAIAAILVAGGLTTSRVATSTSVVTMAPGDTTVVWGPARFDAPIGNDTGVVNQFPEFVVADLQFLHRYIVQVTNGNPDGTERVVHATIDGHTMDSQTAFLSYEIALQAAGTVLDILIDEQPTPGHITINVVDVVAGNFLIFGVEHFARTNTNQNVSFTRTFTRSASAGAPLFLWIRNGNSDGTQRLSGALIKLNGDTIVGPTSGVTVCDPFPPSPACHPQLFTSTYLMMVPVFPVQGSNQLSITLLKQQAGFIDVGITATDITAPVLTISAPPQGLRTRSSSVTVTGTVTDASPVAVKVQGVVAARSGNTYTATATLVEGTNLIPIVAIDAAGVHTDSSRTVVRDSTGPVLIVNLPPNDFLTNQTSTTVSGTVTDSSPPVTVNANSTPLTVTGTTFTGTVSLPTEGLNAVSVTATDALGTGTTVVRMGRRDTQRPALIVNAPANGATVSTPTVTVQGRVSDASTFTLKVNDVVTPVAADSTFTTSAALNVGANTITVIATDAATNADTVVRSVTRTNNGLPPDPATVATAIDPTVATTVFASTAFLYSGANPIQTGVAAGTISPLRSAVLRGRVLSRDGTAVSGATVSILGHAEFGQTLSRADGRYDLAVNGGGQLTLVFAKAGLLDVQRQIDVPWQDFVPVDDVRMVALDAQVASIHFTAPVEVARGSVVTDLDGTRRGTLFFKQGTSATMVRTDGSETTLTTINVRVTEYTVGPTGPEAMPAPLPPASAYTYAAEFSADEVISAGGRELRFSQPVPFYLENFIGFPVGTPVPMAFYDRKRAAWIPSPNGRVVKIVGEAGGLAQLDITGDNVADDATSLGVNDAERQQLATLYDAPQSLWRIPVTHFSPSDANFPEKLPPTAVPPEPKQVSAGGGGGGPATDNSKKDKDDPCKGRGSIVECENQTLGERIPVVGTPFTLNYRSDRVPGRIASHELAIPLIGGTVPAGLAAIVLDVNVAGQVFEDSFPALPNQETRFVWDGHDAYGRTVQGIQPVTIRIGYVYPATYSQPAATDPSFGQPGGPTLSPSVESRVVNTLNQVQRTTLGTWDARGQGFGGWTLSIHHAYDPIGGVLYLGDGTRRSALTLGQTIATVAGTAIAGFAGDGGPATKARLQGPNTVFGAADGSFYIGDTFNGRVRKVSPLGVITTVAGNGQFASNGDGGSAVLAGINEPAGVAVGPDGALYIAEFLAGKIRRVGTDGIISTFAGTGTNGFNGDGQVATATQFNGPFGLAFGPDGALYVGDFNNNRVRRISPDGIVTTVAGTNLTSFNGDGIAATSANLNGPAGVAVSGQGDVYIADGRHNRVRRVSPDGIITTVAGGGTSGYAGDGGAATAAQLSFPQSVAIGREGVLYIADFNNSRVRLVTPEGVIQTFVGNGDFNTVGDGGAPLSAGIDPGWVSMGPDGILYIADVTNDRIRAVRPTLPGLGLGDILIAAADGSQFYRFNPDGRHIGTIDALSGSSAYALSYSAAGLLTSITDASGNVTVIERAPDGTPSAITSAYGARTVLSLCDIGFLDSISDPAGQSFGLHYKADGLLDTLRTPRGGIHRFSYDSLGRLLLDEGPAGASLALERRDLPNATEVELTTAEGRSTVYRLEPLATGGVRRINTDPAGVVSQVVIARSDSVVMTASTGTVTTVVLGSDPRGGLAAPIARRMVTRTPAGVTYTTTSVQHVTLADSANPLSLASQIDSASVNAQWRVATYTAATRQVVEHTPEGRERRGTLDDRGRLIVAKAAGFDSVRFTYDGNGRLSAVQTGSRTWNYDYDARGRVLSVRDPLGRRDSLFYDAADRLVRRVLPNGRTMRLGYDASGNLTSVTTPGQSAHIFQFSGAELMQQYDPPGIPGPKPTRYFYNRDQQLDSILRPDSIKIAVAYDGGGRPATLTFDRGTIGFGYSSTTGRLTSIRSPNGDSLVMSYDGQLSTALRWSGTVTGSVGANYNQDFRVATQTVNGANTATFIYDHDGHLTSAGSMRLGRDAASGQLVADTLVGTQGAYAYTSHAELDRHRVVYGGSALYAARFTRDAFGRVTQRFDTIQGTPTSWSFVYDSVGRLVSDSLNGVVLHAFSYDDNGNRLTFTSSNGTVTYSYDTQDRLLAAGSTSFTHGSHGERSSKSVTGIGTTSYTYDGLGNLVTVVLPSGTRIDYVIDGQNRRVGKKFNGVLVRAWLYQNELNPIAELDGAGNLVSRFVYGGRRNIPDYMVRGGITYRIVSDDRGSVRLVVNASNGAVAQRIDYDEWGTIVQNTTPGFQPFGFATGLLDDDTGLLHFGARDYDPVTGRWLAKDPALFAAGDPNLYAYVGNDPVNRYDPSGLVPCPPNWKQCLYEVGKLGLTALLNKLGEKLFEGLSAAARSERLLEASIRGDATSSLMADFNDIAGAAARSEIAQRMEERAAGLAAGGVVQAGIGAGAHAAEGADIILEQDRPLWWKVLRFIPVVNLGLQLGEVFNACGDAIGQWLLNQ